MSDQANPFEELCHPASRTRWCPSPACTYRGNHHLNAWLALIAHSVPFTAQEHSTTKWPEESVPWTRWTFRGTNAAHYAVEILPGRQGLHRRERSIHS